MSSPLKRKFEDFLGGAISGAISIRKPKFDTINPKPAKRARLRHQTLCLSKNYRVREFIENEAAEYREREALRAAAADRAAAAAGIVAMATASATDHAADEVATVAAAPAADDVAGEATDVNETVDGAGNFDASPARAHRPPKRSRDEPAELLASQELPSDLQLSPNEPKTKRSRPGNIVTAPSGIPANPLPLMPQISDLFEPSNYSATAKNEADNDVFNHAADNANSFTADDADNKAFNDEINHAAGDDTSIAADDAADENEAIDDASNNAADDAIDGASNYTADEAAKETEAGINPSALSARTYLPAKRSSDEPVELLASQESSSNLQLSTNEPKNKRARPGNIATAPTALPAATEVLDSNDAYEGEEEIKEDNENIIFDEETGNDVNFCNEFTGCDEEDAPASNRRLSTDCNVQDLRCLGTVQNEEASTVEENENRAAPASAASATETPYQPEAAPTADEAADLNEPVDIAFNGASDESEADETASINENNNNNNNNNNNKNSVIQNSKKRMLKELESSLGKYWTSFVGAGRRVTRSQSAEEARRIQEEEKAKKKKELQRTIAMRTRSKRTTAT